MEIISIASSKVSVYIASPLLLCSASNSVAIPLLAQYSSLFSINYLMKIGLVFTSLDRSFREDNER